MRWTIFTATILLVAAGIFFAAAQPAANVMTTPQYVPDYSHSGQPLPGGVLAWDSVQKNTDVTNGQDFARFIFAFTNIATKIDMVMATNVAWITNYTIVTNTSFWRVISGHQYSAVAARFSQTNVVGVTNSVAPAQVVILSVRPSCGCTTAELPPVPWILPPGTNSIIKVNVNLAGKTAMPGILPKFVTVTTDHGNMQLRLLINVLPAPPPRPMTEAERAQGIAAAKIDRQAVFKGDCIGCHANNVEGKYGAQLFTAVCAVCHEASPRATMVPDLHNLKDPTSEEFWRAWITSGKPGTLMPAFDTSQGGPLTDLQIASLSAYLNAVIPPRVPPPATK
jgi:mono/diheme cytochrome c family protein